MSINIKVKNITEEQYNHFFNKWLYTYGGATDVVSLEDYIKEYDIDWYGDIDIYQILTLKIQGINSIHF